MINNIRPGAGTQSGQDVQRHTRVLVAPASTFQEVHHRHRTVPGRDAFVVGERLGGGQSTNAPLGERTGMLALTEN